MELIALLAVIAFFAGGKSEDTSLKMMLISKMFIAVATVIFAYVSLLYFNYELSSISTTANDQVSQQKTGWTTSNLPSFLHINSLNELYPWLYLLAISAGLALVMYLIAKRFERKGM